MDYSPPTFYYFRSAMHGKLLDVDHGKMEAGTKVVAHDEHGEDNQIWYEDQEGVIRSKLNGFALDSEGDEFSLQPRQSGKNTQGWMYGSARIYNMYEQNKCADIEKAKRWDGTPIIPYDYEGNDNQHWTKEVVPPKYMKVVCQMHGKLLDVEEASPSPGAGVCCHSDNGDDNQLWFVGYDGVLCSKINGYVLDSSDGKFKMMPYNPDSEHHGWIYAAGRISNRHNPEMVADVKSGRRRDGTDVISYEYNGEDNQHWMMEKP